MNRSKVLVSFLLCAAGVASSGCARHGGLGHPDAAGAGGTGGAAAGASDAAGITGAAGTT
ncbi:MAG: hypothetical protein JWM82_1234, partial [Myxococcales bacterium]|nr:hypothetical protein [Myxococcales bacterium]